jgi:hypothetical protein
MNHDPSSCYDCANDLHGKWSCQTCGAVVRSNETTQHSRTHKARQNAQ